MFKSIGKLSYINNYNNPYKLIVELDDDIGSYYRSLIPKYLKVRKPLYSSHISVVRKEIPTNLTVWGKYQNKLIEIEYDNYIFNDELYFWLNAYSSELEKIRLELGLSSISDITKSPDGRHKFHITIGNLKN